MRELKWRTWLTLAALAFIIALDWQFQSQYQYAFWGLLFVYWALESIRRGEIFLVETIFREDNPALFWGLTLLWAAYGIVMMFAPFIIPGGPL